MTFVYTMCIIRISHRKIHFWSLRLDAKNIATIFRHCEVNVFFVDYEYVEKAGKAVELLMAENTAHYGVVRRD